MIDDELRKKLSVLKQAPVPQGYWDAYWPRLGKRLESVKREGWSVEGGGWRVPFLVPVFSALCFGVLGFLIGTHHLPLPSTLHSSLSTPQPSPVTLEDADSKARRVFHEMQALFPDRVNWVTYVNGKVDFSISSVAHPKSQALIPLIATMSQAQTTFEARVLIRPGERVTAAGQWDKKTPASVAIALPAGEANAHVTCRLNDTAGVDATVDIRKEGVQPLGSFSWNHELVHVQLSRPGLTLHEMEFTKHLL